MYIDDLPPSVMITPLARYWLTRAWSRSSRVKERRLTSGKFTAPSVTPEFTYLTRASPTNQQSEYSVRNNHKKPTFNTNGVLGLLSTATDMRSEDDILQAAKILCPRIQAVCKVVAVSTRLTWIYIQSRTSNLTTAGS